VGEVSVAWVADEGEWFDPGTRVEYAPTSPRRRERRLAKAVLGSYEVVRCERLAGDDARLLTVTLRPLFGG
jgi:hypothetical protein